MSSLNGSKVSSSTATSASAPALLLTAESAASSSVGYDTALVASTSASNSENLMPSTTNMSTNATTSTSADPHSDDHTISLLSTKRLPNVPNEIITALTVKIGDIRKQSRRHLSISHFRFLLNEGYEVFKAKVNSRTTKEIKNSMTTEKSVRYVRDDFAIYIRPGVHSKQTELVELTETNFEERIARSYRNFLKRKAGGNPVDHFECEIYTYVRKQSGKKRSSNAPTPTNASVPTPGLPTFMEYADHGAANAMTNVDISSMPLSLHGGPIGGSMHHQQVSSSESLKRKHDQAFTQSSTTSAFGTTPEPLDFAAHQSFVGDYKSVRMILNGSVVSVKVNVRDILGALGMLQQPVGMSTTPTETQHSASHLHLQQQHVQDNLPSTTSTTATAAASSSASSSVTASSSSTHEADL